MAQSMNITIKHVAKHAGVSVATASRAINGIGRISEETKERILKSAQELNYVPHIGARSLITKRTGLIGVLLPDLYGEFFSEIVRGIDGAAQLGGYNILLASYHNDIKEIKTTIATLRGRVDGIVAMFPFSTNDDELSATLNAPLVKISNQAEGNKIPSIAIDNFEGAKIATSHLINIGCKKIAHLSGPITNLEAVDRLRGYNETMRNANLEAIIFQGDFGENCAFKLAPIIAKQIKCHEIDGVFAGNDMMAVGLINGLKQVGINIPEDVAIMGFDNIPIATYISPSLSSVGVDMSALGKRAVEILSNLMNKNDHYGEIASFTPIIYRRGTTNKN
jgi:LacI family transcriptional regulator